MRYYSKNRARKKFLSEINVTPFVDVMLVLLIVFMITAPLLQTGVEIELPEADTPNTPENKEPIIISINKDEEVFISNKLITPDILKEKLKEIKKANPRTQIYIRADKSVTYNVLMKTMEQIMNSGILNINLITLPKK